MITKEQIDLAIKGKLEGKTAVVIADELNLKVHQVYDVYKRKGITRKQNQLINIDENMNQIILGGILGDGSIKRNGLNCYYRECHSLGESEYCYWKKEQLKELTKNSVMYCKNSNNKYGDAIEFTTKTTPSLNSYIDMDYEEVIPLLNKLGLLVYLLDDGWRNKKAIYIATSHLNEGVRKLIQKQYNICFGINTYYQNKCKDLVIPADGVGEIYKWLKESEVIPLDIDVIEKKFYNIKKEQKYNV